MVTRRKKHKMKYQGLGKCLAENMNTQFFKPSLGGKIEQGNALIDKCCGKLFFSSSLI